MVLHWMVHTTPTSAGGDRKKATTLRQHHRIDVDGGDCMVDIVSTVEKNHQSRLCVVSVVVIT